jgi:hypothetical protein
MDVLREAREAAGISQRNLSTLLNRPKNFGSLVETGQRMLDTSEFKAYVMAFGGDPAVLYAEIMRRSPGPDQLVITPAKAKPRKRRKGKRPARAG